MVPLAVGSPAPPQPAPVDDAEGVPGAAAGLEAAVVAGAEAGYTEHLGGLETEVGGSAATEVSPPG